jgi:hypothetical protein
MAAPGGAAADASPLLRADEHSASAVALPLSAWAIHDDPSPQQAPPAARPAKADPLLDGGEGYSSYQGGAAAPAPSAPPAADAGPYVAGQPLPGAPATGAFYPQPYSAAAAAPLSAGPPLEAPSLGCWGWAALLFNAAVLALLLCVALDAGGARQALGAASGLAYLAYLALCLCSPSAKALRNCMSAAALQAHTAAVRAARPEVWAEIVCWHNETRTRHVTETGKDGKKHSRRETYTVRVETHRARGAWGYRGVRDISGEPVHQPYLPMLEVHYKPCVRAPASPPAGRRGRALRHAGALVSSHHQPHLPRSLSPTPAAQGARLSGPAVLPRVAELAGVLLECQQARRAPGHVQRHDHPRAHTLRDAAAVQRVVGGAGRAPAGSGGGLRHVLRVPCLSAHPARALQYC